MQDAGSPDLYQNSSHDRFLQKFKNCLDNRQYLVPKRLRPADCCLTDVQINGIVRQLMLPVMIIEGFALPVWKIQRKIQKIIFDYEATAPIHLKQTHIKAAGRSAAEIIESDPEYLKSIFGAIQQNVDIPDSEKCISNFLDLDYKIVALSTNYVENLGFRDKLATWLAYKISKHPKWANQTQKDLLRQVNDQLNKKFCNPSEEGPLGNRFMLISIGDRSLSVDVVIAQNLRRDFLLSPDRIQIPYNIVKIKKEDGSKTITLTHHTFQKKYDINDKPAIRPNLKFIDLVQTLLDRKAKIVHFPQIDTMDFNGWFKLMQYYVEGYRAAEDERVLLDLAAIPGYEIAFAKRLNSFVAAHFQDETSLYFYYLNCLFCLNRHGKLQFSEAIRCARPEWFGKSGLETQQLTRMLNCMGLLLLSTMTTGETFYVELTTSSLQPALRWTYKIGKKSYSFLMPFTFGNFLKDFAELFHESPQFFTALLRGRQTKKDLSLIIALLKLSKINEEMLLAFIQSLGDESHPDAALMAQYWLPVAKALKTTQSFSSSDQVIDYLRNYLPTLRRKDFQEQYQPVVLDLLKLCLVHKNPKELAVNLTLIFELSDANPWMLEGDLGNRFQRECFEPLEECFNSANKLSVWTDVINSIKGKKLQKIAAPLLVNCIQQRIIGFQNPQQMLRTLMKMLELGACYPWIRDQFVGERIQERTFLRIEDHFKALRNLSELDGVLTLGQESVLQRDLIAMTRHLAEHAMKVSEDRKSHADMLISSLETHPWLYENDLADSLGYIERLLQNSSPEKHAAFAQECLGKCFDQNLAKDKVALIFPFVTFSKLSPVVKKKIQGIYYPIIQTLYDAGKYDEIIYMYQWLGISATSTPSQVKRVLPKECNDAFKKTAGTFFRDLFTAHLSSKLDSQAIYTFFLHVREWHVECPWVFESQHHFLAFEINLFQRLHDQISANPNLMIVVLKEVLSMISPNDHVCFASHARALIAQSLFSKGDLLIWNITSIQVCYHQYPWIYENHDQEKREMIVSVIQTLAELSRSEQRLNNLIDLYLDELLGYPGTASIVVNLLVESSINVSNSLKVSIKRNGKRIAEELIGDSHQADLIRFYLWTHLHGVRWVEDESTSYSILKAFADSEVVNLEKEIQGLLKSYVIKENEQVIELFLKISAKLLKSGKANELESLLTQIQSILPNSYRACGCLFYDHMVECKPTSEHLSLCRSLALDESWSFARDRDVVKSQRYAEAVFTLAKETNFKKISVFEAFRLIGHMNVFSKSEWGCIFDHLGSVKRKQDFEAIWKAFLALPIPPEHTHYLKAWIQGLNVALKQGIVTPNAVPVLYNRLQTIGEIGSNSTLCMEINLSLFKFLADASVNGKVLSDDCWTMIKRIASGYDKMPPSMEVDYIQLCARSPQIDDFICACRRLYSRLSPTSPTDVALAVDVMKQIRKFKASQFKEDKTDFFEATLKVFMIYQPLELSIEDEQEVFNAFIESESRKLIDIVLVRLSNEMKFVKNRDGSISFTNFKCLITPNNLLALFDYILKAPDLTVGSKRLARRILGHPSTAPLLRSRVTVDHWIKDLNLRALSPELYSTAEDFSIEINELILLSYAPPGFATDPSTVLFYLRMIETIFLKGNPVSASEIQGIYFHCGLGGLAYEKRYALISQKWESHNAFLKGTEYLVVNPSSPCFKSEQWQRTCLEFQVQLLEKLSAKLLLHGTLEDERGEYLRLFIQKQISIILDIYQKMTFKISQDLKAKLVKEINFYFATVMRLPKKQEAEIEFLNMFTGQYLSLNNVFKSKADGYFYHLAAMQSVLATLYTNEEVPYRLCTFDSDAKWRKVHEDFTDPYTDIAMPYGHLDYYFKLMLSFLRKNTEALPPPFVHQMFNRIFIYLEMRPAAINGLTQNPDRSDYHPISSGDKLKGMIKNLKTLELIMRQATDNLLKQVEGKLSSTFTPYEIIDVLWGIMSKWFELANRYPELSRQVFSPIHFGLEIYTLIEPYLIKFGFRKNDCPNPKEKFEFISLAMGIVFKEAGICLHQNQMDALIKLSCLFSQVIMLRRWSLDEEEKKASDQILKSFILNLGKFVYMSRPNELIGFLQKLFDYALQQGAFRSFTPDVMQSLENIVSGNYNP